MTTTYHITEGIPSSTLASWPPLGFTKPSSSLSPTISSSYSSNGGISKKALPNPSAKILPPYGKPHSSTRNRNTLVTIPSQDKNNMVSEKMDTNSSHHRHPIPIAERPRWRSPMNKTTTTEKNPSGGGVPLRPSLHSTTTTIHDVSTEDGIFTNNSSRKVSSPVKLPYVTGASSLSIYTEYPSSLLLTETDQQHQSRTFHGAQISSSSSSSSSSLPVVPSQNDTVHHEPAVVASSISPSSVQNKIPTTKVPEYSSSIPSSASPLTHNTNDYYLSSSSSSSMVIVPSQQNNNPTLGAHTDNQQRYQDNTNTTNLTTSPPTNLHLYQTYVPLQPQYYNYPFPASAPYMSPLAPTNVGSGGANYNSSSSDIVVPPPVNTIPSSSLISSSPTTIIRPLPYLSPRNNLSSTTHLNSSSSSLLSPATTTSSSFMNDYATLKAQFDAIDTNHNGKLDSQELINYLVIVFTNLLQFSSNKSVYNVHPTGILRPAELATVTALRAIQEADTNGDGQLSFDEFLHWVHRDNNLSPHPVTVPVDSSLTYSTSLSTLKNTTNVPPTLMVVPFDRQVAPVGTSNTATNKNTLQPYTAVYPSFYTYPSHFASASPTTNTSPPNTTAINAPGPYASPSLINHPSDSAYGGSSSSSSASSASSNGTNFPLSIPSSPLLSIHSPDKYLKNNSIGFSRSFSTTHQQEGIVSSENEYLPSKASSNAQTDYLTVPSINPVVTDNYTKTEVVPVVESSSDNLPKVRTDIILSVQSVAAVPPEITTSPFPALPTPIVPPLVYLTKLFYLHHYSLRSLMIRIASMADARGYITHKKFEKLFQDLMVPYTKSVHATTATEVKSRNNFLDKWWYSLVHTPGMTHTSSSVYTTDYIDFCILVAGASLFTTESRIDKLYLLSEIFDTGREKKYTRRGLKKMITALFATLKVVNEIYETENGNKPNTPEKVSTDDNTNTSSSSTTTTIDPILLGKIISEESFHDIVHKDTKTNDETLNSISMEIPTFPDTINCDELDVWLKNHKLNILNSIQVPEEVTVIVPTTNKNLSIGSTSEVKDTVSLPPSTSVPVSIVSTNEATLSNTLTIPNLSVVTEQNPVRTSSNANDEKLVSSFPSRTALPTPALNHAIVEDSSAIDTVTYDDIHSMRVSSSPLEQHVNQENLPNDTVPPSVNMPSLGATESYVPVTYLNSTVPYPLSNASVIPQGNIVYPGSLVYDLTSNTMRSVPFPLFPHSNFAYPTMVSTPYTNAVSYPTVYSQITPSPYDADSSAPPYYIPVSSSNPRSINNSAMVHFSTLEKAPTTNTINSVPFLPSYHGNGSIKMFNGPSLPQNQPVQSMINVSTSVNNTNPVTIPTAIPSDYKYSNRPSIEPIPSPLGSPDNYASNGNEVPETLSSPVVRTSSPTVPLIWSYFDIGNRHCDEVIETFSRCAGNNGLLSHDSFISCFVMYLRPEYAIPSPDNPSTKTIHPGFASQIVPILDRIFTSFDADHSGTIDFTELASGLTGLCGVTSDEKIQAAFDVLDFNGDGKISREELVLYLTSLFKMSLAGSLNNEESTTITTPNNKDNIRVTPHEIAQATAAEAFARADANNDGFLTLDEFKAWYATPPTTPLSATARFTVLQAAGPFNITDMEEILSRNREGNNTGSNIPSQSIQTSVSGASNTLLTRTNSKTIPTAPPLGASPNTVMYPRLHSSTTQTVGNDENNYMTSATIENFPMRSLSHVSAVSVPLPPLPSSATSSFESVDNGFSSLVRQTSNVSKASTTGSGFNPSRSSFSLLPLNSVRALLGFNRLPISLVLAHFARYAEIDPLIKNTNGSNSHTTVPSSSMQTPLLRATTSISAPSSTLSLSRRSFNAAIASLVDQVESQRETSNESIPNSSSNNNISNSVLLPVVVARMRRARSEDNRLILSRLFDIFDADKSGRVDFAELLAGISLLCGDDREGEFGAASDSERIAAAFALYDANGDGYITMDEMTAYLTAIMTVVLNVYTPAGILSSMESSETGNSTLTNKSLTRSVSADSYKTSNQLPVTMDYNTPETLARATAIAAFTEADTNRDGRLSLQEFLTWLTSPGAAVHTAVRAVVLQAATAGNESTYSSSTHSRRSSIGLSPHPHTPFNVTSTIENNFSSDTNKNEQSMATAPPYYDPLSGAPVVVNDSSTVYAPRSLSECMKTLNLLNINIHQLSITFRQYQQLYPLPRNNYSNNYNRNDNNPQDMVYSLQWDNLRKCLLDISYDIPAEPSINQPGYTEYQRNRCAQWLTNYIFSQYMYPTNSGPIDSINESTSLSQQLYQNESLFRSSTIPVKEVLFLLMQYCTENTVSSIPFRRETSSHSTALSTTQPYPVSSLSINTSPTTNNVSNTATITNSNFGTPNNPISNPTVVSAIPLPLRVTLRKQPGTSNHKLLPIMTLNQPSNYSTTTVGTSSRGGNKDSKSDV